MCIKKTSLIFLVVLFLVSGLTGCADKNVNLADIDVRKLAQYSDKRGQANVKLYMYSGEVKEKNIKAYAEKLGCNMLFAYFYPDTVPLNEIPVEEIRSAKSFNDTHEILFNGEGYASWRFAARCFAVIPIVVDCQASRVTQNCR